MNFIKTIFAFILSLVATFFCYTSVSIPVLPCATVYLAAFFLLSGSYFKLRRVLSVITGLFGIYLFAVGAIESIIFYPNYMTILGIIFSFVTAFAYIGSTIFCCAALTSSIKNN